MVESVTFKNVQIVDGALNATYSLFQATAEEFDVVFPQPGQDMEIVEDFLSRAGQAVAADFVDENLDASDIEARRSRYSRDAFLRFFGASGVYAIHEA